MSVLIVVVVVVSLSSR